MSYTADIEEMTMFLLFFIICSSYFPENTIFLSKTMPFIYLIADTAEMYQNISKFKKKYICYVCFSYQVYVIKY
jgi:hypothetical protein